MRFFRVIKSSRLPADGMALFPFIMVKKDVYKKDKTLINHERIHLQQQIELLIIPFYVLYLLNYLFNVAVYRKHQKAYRNIAFEREAYSNENDFNYLDKRPLFSWLRYL